MKKSLVRLIIPFLLCIFIFQSVSFAFEDLTFITITDALLPIDIGVDETGGIYVSADSTDAALPKRVVKLDDSGGFLWEEYIDPYEEIQSLTVTSDGYSYVVIKGGSDYVVKMNPEGTEVWRYPFGWIQDIAVDPFGYVYVADHISYGNGMVAILDPGGSLIDNEFWPSPIRYPYDVAVYSGNYIYIIDNEFWTLKKYNWISELQEEYEIPFSANNMVLGPEYIYLHSTNEIHYFDRDLIYKGAFSGSLTDIRTMAVHPDGSVYVADSSTIYQFSQVGGFLGELSHDFNDIQEIAIDSNGALYVAENSKVLKSQSQTPGFTIIETDGNTTVSETASTDNFSLVLNTAPDSDVILNISSSDTEEATVTPATLTFTSANWSTSQTITVTGVDDDVDDGDQTSVITVSVDANLSDDEYDSVANKTVSVITTDDDTAGFTLSKTDITVDEGGSLDIFTLVLDTEPTSDVIFDVVSTDISEATVTPTSLTFTHESWNAPQEIIVTGADDDVDDGNQISVITVSVNADLSDDGYDSVAGQNVSVTTTDDDTAGFTLSKTDVTVDEGGSPDTFTVVLNSEPTNNVIFDVSISDTSEATETPASLTFEPSNWNTPQTLTVTGVDDDVDDGDQTSDIIISVDPSTTDANYVSLDKQSVSATTLDDDTAGFTLSKSDLTVTEAGSTETFTLVLDTEPTSDVFFEIGSSDSSEATVDPTDLVFTPDDWDDPQPITVTGVDDDLIDGDMTSLISVSVTTGTVDLAYDSLDPETVSVTTQNDDFGVSVATVLLDHTDIVISEGYPTTLAATILPEDATEPVFITWHSSDPTKMNVHMLESSDIRVSIEAVNNAEGNAILTVWAENDYGIASAGCHVTILKPVDYLLYVIDQCVCDDTLVANGDEDKIDEFIELIEETKLLIENQDLVAAQNKLDEVYAKIDVSPHPKDLVTDTSEFGLANMILTLRDSLTVPVTGLQLNHTELTLQVRESETLIATIQPSDATNLSLIWTTSDKSIVKINNDGIVTAKGVGTATITVTTFDGGFTATCTVTVINP